MARLMPSDEANHAGAKTPLEKRLEELRLRHQISVMDDDSTLEPDLAAIYLGLSLKKLEQMRLRAEKAGGSTDVSPPFIKIVEHGTSGRNQAIRYKLGDLRDFQRRFKVKSSFEASLNAGLTDWTRSVHQFYVRTADDQPTIVAAVDDIHDPERGSYFMQFMRGELDIREQTLRRAAKLRWLSADKERLVKDALRRLLHAELESLN